MVTKHKKHAVRERKEADLNPKWIVIAGILLVVILINTVGRNSPFVQSLIGRFKPSPTPTPTVPVNMLPPDKIGQDQASYVQMAIYALTARLNIKKEDVKVLSVKETQWSDTSLGCPEKGKLYIQTITPGFTIELSAKGEKYIYNGGSDRVVSC